jgi:hypothetical protein
VWINPHPFRWRVCYLPVRQDVKRGPDSLILGEDQFLLQWMRLLGMKPYHDFFSKGLINGGRAIEVHNFCPHSSSEDKSCFEPTMRARVGNKVSGSTKIVALASNTNSPTQSRPSLAQSPHSSSQLRQSIRSRTIRKQSVLFQNPIAVSEHFI